MNTELVTEVAEKLSRLNWMLATAESCTGGMIAAQCTDLAGSSAWFDCGFVSYSNHSKTQLLGLDSTLLLQHGAVSQAVAMAMALGAVARSQAHVSVAVTGIAGPGGATADKPVGTVWLAWVVDGEVSSERQQFQGDRQAIRQATTVHALKGLLARLSHL